MGNDNLLSCLEKRDLLNQPAVSVDTLMQWGDRYLEAGLVYDAVDFYEKAGAVEALTGLLDLAKTDGDAFLLRRLCAILGREPTSQEWLAVAERAQHLGKERHAVKSFESAGVQRGNNG